MPLINQAQRFQDRYNNIGYGVYINYTQKEEQYSKDYKRKQQTRFRNAVLQIHTLQLPPDPTHKITTQSLTELIKILDKYDWSIKSSFMKCHKYITEKFY